MDNSSAKFSCEMEQKATWENLRKGKRLSVEKEIKRSNSEKCRDRD